MKLPNSLWVVCAGAASVVGVLVVHQLTEKRINGEQEFVWISIALVATIAIGTILLKLWHRKAFSINRVSTPKPVVIVVASIAVIALCCGGPLLLIEGILGPTRPSKTAAEVAARSFVREKLKDPSSADFGWDAPFVVEHGNNSFTVTGKVRSKNSFNATVENYYSCKLEYDGRDWSGAVIFVDEKS